MRTIISGILFLFIMSSASFAIGNFYVDGMGAFTQTGDAENQFGGGINVLYQITDEFNVFIKNIFNTRKVNHAASADERYEYFMHMAGLEYLYNISNLPLFWKSALGLGAANTSIKTDNSGQYDEMGFCCALWTGIMYTFTQNISGFLDVGYHKTFYFDELKNESIMGVQVLLGVRVTVWGTNKSIYSGY